MGTQVRLKRDELGSCIHQQQVAFPRAGSELSFEHWKHMALGPDTQHDRVHRPLFVGLCNRDDEVDVAFAVAVVLQLAERRHAVSEGLDNQPA
ncbi:MAG: hypothetical protein C0607_16325 [Azoarcus sp.]|nr:MAG: hypothetical protein C0607_16325 [Azoarcus sp.]